MRAQHAEARHQHLRRQALVLGLQPARMRIVRGRVRVRWHQPKVSHSGNAEQDVFMGGRFFACRGALLWR